MNVEGKVVYIISPNHWGVMQISKHHYARELTKRGAEVYFISPPSLDKGTCSSEEIEKNLFVVHYKPLFRGMRFLPGFITDQLIKLQIARFRKRIGKKPDILWSFDLSIYMRLDWFKAEHTIFHPVDEMTSQVKRAAESADVVFTVSEHLMNQLAGVSTPIHVVDHGVAPFFTDHDFKPATTTEKMNIGYVGNLFMKDLHRPLLKNVIEANPDHHFHFFGAKKPSNSNISAWVRPGSLEFVTFLEEAKNVTLHGPVHPSELPARLEEMNAFMVCYQINELNAVSNSHKILEYLCTGRVVISTPVERYIDSPLIAMTKTQEPEDFAELFKQVADNQDEFNSAEIQEERRNFALSNSYKAQTTKILEHLAQV